MEEQKIVDHLIKISADIGSMNSKLDSLNTALINHVKEDKETHDTEDKRIDALENAQNRVKWIAVGAGGVFAGLWKAIELWFTSGGHH